MRTVDFERSFVFVRTGDKMVDNALEKLELELRKLYQYQGGGGSGDMLKSVYDTNNNGVVDNSEKLNGKSDTDFASANHTHPGMGDMLKSVYDTDNDGVVDNAEKIDGRKIYVSDSLPTAQDGQDGDIWLEY